MVARMELRRASTRMRDFHAERRRQGLRRRDTTPPAIADRLLELRQRGLSYPRIGALLDSEGVPTTAGGARWWPATVRKTIEARKRELADREEVE
jgi:hypothetical protein